MLKRKAVLMILDGWGIGRQDETDAIFAAQTPYLDQLLAIQPHTTLKTYGEHVGLPDGQMGNSEVGHLNIGAGRIVYQDLVRINKAIAEGTIDQNPVLQQAFEAARKSGKAVHLDRKSVV